MILTLEEAQAINPGLVQDDVDAFEAMVRSETSNHFVNPVMRFEHVTIAADGGITYVPRKSNGNHGAAQGKSEWLRPGDTALIGGTYVNDGLCQIVSADATTITVDKELQPGAFGQGFLSQVKYPADVKFGVKKLMEYDAKMGTCFGVIAQQISKVRYQYADFSQNTQLGYPKYLLDFLEPYYKVRWG